MESGKDPHIDFSKADFSNVRIPKNFTSFVLRFSNRSILSHDFSIAIPSDEKLTGYDAQQTTEEDEDVQADLEVALARRLRSLRSCFVVSSRDFSHLQNNLPLAPERDGLEEGRVDERAESSCEENAFSLVQKFTTDFRGKFHRI